MTRRLLLLRTPAIELVLQWRGHDDAVVAVARHMVATVPELLAVAAQLASELTRQPVLTSDVRLQSLQESHPGAPPRLAAVTEARHIDDAEAIQVTPWRAAAGGLSAVDLAGR